MKKIAIVKSVKPYENRVALLPHHLKEIKKPKKIYIEKNYAKHLGIDDHQYQKYGANIVENKAELLSMDVVVDPKIGDADYFENISDGTVLFGYFHAVQNKKLTDILVKKKSICYAWEDMFQDGIHLFNYNNQLAGYASVMHSSVLWGSLMKGKNAAILGRGNTAIGAIEALSKLGANLEVLGRHSESSFRKRLNEFDIIVNAVLWDVSRNDYIISKEDLKMIKKGSLIIDISCDIDGAIETSSPSLLDNPMKITDGIFHYSLSNSPTVYSYEASNHFGNVIVKYLNQLCDGTPDKTLKESLIISNGNIIDSRISEHQKRKK